MTQLHKAYVSLAVCANNDDSLRMAPIKRFGALEVRLVEFAPGQADTLDIWIELYDHETQSTLDSCLCGDLDEAEPVLEHLLASARHSAESRPSFE